MPKRSESDRRKTPSKTNFTHGKCGTWERPKNHTARRVYETTSAPCGGAGGDRRGEIDAVAPFAAARGILPAWRRGARGACNRLSLRSRFTLPACAAGCAWCRRLIRLRTRTSARASCSCGALGSRRGGHAVRPSRGRGLAVDRAGAARARCGARPSLRRDRRPVLWSIAELPRRGADRRAGRRRMIERDGRIYAELTSALTGHERWRRRSHGQLLIVTRATTLSRAGVGALGGKEISVTFNREPAVV
jgi:hypothetical protein